MAPWSGDGSLRGCGPTNSAEGCPRTPAWPRRSRSCDHDPVDLPPRSAVDHGAGRPQHWHDADRDVRRWVDDIVSLIEEAVPTVSGVYLHGSLAMGSYFRPKSDVDLLVVVTESLSDRDRRALAVQLLDAFDARPTIGGVELSVVRRGLIGRFQHPLPYEFHFSEKWAEEVRSGGSGPRGTDVDLAAHCTMARCRGLALRGEEPAKVIADVPRDAFLDSIMDDFGWIVDGGILESPFYGVLNLCRVLQVVDEPALPPSKEESAVWALEHVPAEHHLIVTDALECYRSAAEIPVGQRRVHGHQWNDEALRALAAFAREVVALKR